MNNKETQRALANALAYIIFGVPVEKVEPRKRVINHEPIHGLTNTFEGVRTQCMYATAEAKMLGREYCEV